MLSPLARFPCRALTLALVAVLVGGLLQLAFPAGRWHRRPWDEVEQRWLLLASRSPRFFD